ncbi:hypothetical protein Scep_030809 [Stephania cephalantha]|uniref:DELLA protein n=1 Tax=Stephania cephalantha TaxID=152367 RepID=A0AAP0E856_9MAGN
MRVAGALLLQFNEQNGNNVDVAMLMEPFSCDGIGLAKEENKDVELAGLLIAAAEKVGNKQFDQASKLLTKCDYLSSTSGTPVQRVVYQFGEALRERINRQTGRIPIEDYFLQERIHLEYVEEAMMSPNSALLACYQLLPFCKVLNFAGIQAVIDNIASAKKVHFIQIGIKIGVECSILMQALATRRGVSLEHFKLTTIVTRNQKKVEETGKRLASFADSMNIPFIFNVIGLSDMKDIKEELFSREEKEVVAVYCPFVLRTMIPWPDQLETLIRVIRKLHPCVMVVYEVEGNHNSPLFVNRFIESLFFYSAFFDCLEECMDRDNQDRINIEINYFGQGILNVVAAEGEERVVRHVGIDVWRSFFSRFGLVETELSYSSIYQANLVNKQFACANSCTLGMNGKSLTVGWKGTPIHSLSTWKFRNV